MPDNRSEAMLRLIANAADDYYSQFGRYPSKVRVGPTVAGFFLKAGERQVRIALRPGGTTLWITLVADNGMGPMEIVVES
jgi:hypothetical protein